MERVANYRLTDAHIKKALNAAADSDTRVAEALNLVGFPPLGSEPMASIRWLK